MPKPVRKNYRQGVVWTTAALLLICCGVGVAGGVADNPNLPKTEKAPVTVTDLLQSSPRARADYQILVGELALHEGDTSHAAQAYAKALEAVPDAELAKRAMQIAIAAKRNDLAYNAAKIRSDDLPDDLDAQRAVVRLAFLQRDKAGLRHFAPRVVAAADNPQDGYKYLAQVLNGKPNRADLAVATLQSLQKAHPDEAAASYALARLALTYGRVDVAERAAKSAVDADPKWAPAVLLQAGIDVQKGRFDAARDRINALPGSDRERSDYQVFLARALLKAGQDKAGVAAFQKAVAIDPENGDARYGFGLAALSEDDLDTARAQFSKLYKKKSHADDAAFLLGVIAERSDDREQALRWYARVGAGQYLLDAKLRSARLTYEMGELDKARTQLHALAKEHPDQKVRIEAVEGSLLVQADKAKEALAVYDHALAAAPDNADLLYARSLAYARLDRADAAEADLKKLLAADPDNAAALNALGYVLTNHSNEYERAEKYIRKALSIEPDSPEMLDSLGWVEYKRGRLQKALKHLEKAYKASPGPEIAAHLGEVHWQLGDHDAAREIWHKAAAKDPDNKVLEQTMKRFES